MINWWLIGFLVFIGCGWAIAFTKSLNKSTLEGVTTLITIAVIISTMYMSGMLTELWDVYK